MIEPLRCLILAPTGKDTPLIAETLATAGFLPNPCASLPELCDKIASGAGVVIIAEEALVGPAAVDITAALAEHPVWSMLPFVLLTSAATSSDFDPAILDLFGPRASVTIIERPCRSATLTTSVRSAIHARQAQFEVRSLLERLDRQAKDLEWANKDLHRFAFAASHDLQEPLRSITSYLTLIEKRNAHAFDERSRIFFKHVIDGAERMRGLIRALLEYGKVGEAKPRMTTFPSDTAVGEAVHNLHAMIEESHALITICPMPVIHADSTLITVLLQNLIGNALKYRSAEPRVEITGRESDSEWVFAVADNGIGIAQHHQDRIFEAFQRLHTSDEYTGHGIGLATCRRVADIHGGRIWVESSVGVGSTFFFSIHRAP